MRIYSRIWQAAFFCFILAALTGVVYRFTLVGWTPGSINMANIRHAHSHLMFFGWAVPLPLYVLLSKIVQQTRDTAKPVQVMRWSIWGTLVFGLLAYASFLKYGYESVRFGEVSLPPSVILSGLVMISWYCYIGGYLRVRSRLRPDAATPWYEASLLMLVISSLGAWAIAILQFSSPQNQLLAKALTHFFLAGFTEGWVVLAVMAILYQKLDPKGNNLPVASGKAVGLIAFGAMLTFPFGISVSLLSNTLLTTARLGGIMASAGLLMALYPLFKSAKIRKSIWIWPLSLLTIKAVMQLGASVIPSDFWLSDHALRILYLHVLLLGAYTLTCAAWKSSKSKLNNTYYYMVLGSIAAVLASLVLLTPIWPSPWSGIWILYAAAGAAILPVIAMAAFWLKLATNQVTDRHARY